MKSRTENSKGEADNRFRGLRASVGELLALSLFLIVSFTLVCCAPKQVHIPIAERAVLEKQGAQDLESNKMSSTSRETLREGRDGQGGITEQDISGGAGGGHGQGGIEKNVPARDIYFDFDSYTLKSEDLAELKDLSVRLKANRTVRLTVEGHCDERGSIEYNMALGQKRAEAVREYLLTLGVDEGRVRAISYGKEIPADAAHTEEAWAKNRRAHLKID